jgi:GWxTD domain-containing protein
MYKSRFLFSFLTLLSLSLSLAASNLRVTFDHKVFYQSATEARFETYLLFDIETIHFKSDEESNEVFSRLEVLQIVYDESNEIVDYEKDNLTSRFNPDSAALDDFLHKQIYLLKAGRYKIEIEISDLNNPSQKRFTHSENFEIKEQDNSNLSFGEFMLVNAIENTSTGSNLIPKLINHYSSVEDKIIYYTEIHNADQLFKDESFLVYHSIFDKGTGKIVDKNQAYKKVVANEFSTPILHQFDLSNLGSGSYLAQVEIRNRENTTLLKTSKDFTRTKVQKLDFSDPSLDVNATFVDREVKIDSIEQYINCLLPIADESEKNFINNYIGKYDDKEVMKRFFYTFWFNRNNKEPEKAWAQYKSDVAHVNREYGTRIKQGWQTDRGRVYLVYGPPNTIVDRPNDYEVYPYQIWHYYKANQFNNRRFVFYNQDLISNDYELLHSDVPGEIRNQRWNMFLHQRNQTLRDIDQTAPNTAASRIIEDFYLNPR